MTFSFFLYFKDANENPCDSKRGDIRNYVDFANKSCTYVYCDSYFDNRLWTQPGIKYPTSTVKDDRATCDHMFIMNFFLFAREHNYKLYTHFYAQYLYTINRIYIIYLIDTAVIVWFIAEYDCKTKTVWL